jgi:predicted NBD/HSP70 family sugar kinase
LSFPNAGELLDIGFANLVYLFDPESIVVGEGMADIKDLISEPIRRTMRDCCYLIAKE